MAEQPPMQRPQPPAGFQRPGVPGAGNLLDPEARGELREQIHEAAHGAGQQVRERQQGSEESEKEEQPAVEKPVKYRAGPFPHGDVDLRGFAANVPAEPVKPRRGGAGRRFYFLREQSADAAGEPPVSGTSVGPRPG